MSTRNLDTGYVIGKRLITISGNFVPLTGAGTIVASQVNGFGFGFAPVNGVMTARTFTGSMNNPVPKSTPGIARTGTGLYTVTLEDPYAACTYFGADLASPVAGSALWAQPVEPVANLNAAFTAPVFSILIVNASGTPTDASANMRLYFEFELRDSTWSYQKP